MLQDFFRLDPQFVVLTSTQELVNRFANSNELRNALFEPDELRDQPNTLFRDRSFHNVSFSKTEVSNVTINRCRFEDCLFIGSMFEHCEFHDCEFINCNFHKATFKNCYFDPSTIYLDKCYRKTHTNIGTHLFQELLVNSKHRHQAKFADVAELNFRRWRRWQRAFEAEREKEAKGRNWVWFKKRVFVCKEWLIDLTIGYGIKPFNFVVSSAVLLLGMSAIVDVSWASLGLVNGDMPAERDGFLDSVYYTTVVITTLGFGDLTPSMPVGRLLSLLYSLFGVVWLSVLAAMVIRKVVR